MPYLAGPADRHPRELTPVLRWVPGSPRAPPLGAAAGGSAVACRARLARAGRTPGPGWAPRPPRAPPRGAAAGDSAVTGRGHLASGDDLPAGRGHRTDM